MMFLMTATPKTGMITDMPELDEMITITEATELADGRYTRRHITQVAHDGAFAGAVRVARVWLIPRVEFQNWLKEDRRPGPKTED